MPIHQTLRHAYDCEVRARAIAIELWHTKRAKVTPTGVCSAISAAHF